MLTHLTKPGETLWSIVQSYGLKPPSLAINNIIVANKLWRYPYLKSGQVLNIPVDGLYYVVKPGDTLWQISKKFEVPMDVLISENHLSAPYIIHAGDNIHMPNKKFDPTKYLISIDPGHQAPHNTGTEPVAPGSTVMKQKVSAGAQGVKTGKPEYQLNLEVALKTAQILELMGYHVLMSRTTNDVNLSNIERAEVANNANATLSVRIHADSSLDQHKSGISVLYPGMTTQYMSEAVMQKSKQLAQFLLRDLIKETNADSLGTVPRTDITGFNWSKIPVALVEMGFMSNPQEDVKMSTPSYQYQIAEGISEGITSYLSAMG